MQLCDRSRRHFTEAAREAAALARRRKRDDRAQNPEDHALALVVVRDVAVHSRFLWQIRRFGQVGPVAVSAVSFRDADEATRTGRAALDAMKATTPRD